MADVFDNLLKKHQPDLAVFFTNHVAAAMHRYWFAAFPQDWDTELYDEGWVQRFGGELPFAMDMLDLWLGRWLNWCEQNDRTLVITTSMGQTGGSEVDTALGSVAVLDDAVSFAHALGIEGDFEVGKAMVPQVTYLFDGEDAASNASTAAKEHAGVHATRTGRSVTVAYDAEKEIPRPQECGCQRAPLWYTRSTWLANRGQLP